MKTLLLPVLLCVGLAGAPGCDGQLHETGAGEGLSKKRPPKQAAKKRSKKLKQKQAGKAREARKAKATKRNKTTAKKKRKKTRRAR